jgi:hypothetical protein
MSTTRNGNVYIERASFTKAHGASPTTAEAETEAAMSMPLQQLWQILIGDSLWNGIVVEVQDIKREGSGLTTRLRAIDLRDYLFSDSVFLKINMIDPNTGEVYHVIPEYDGVEFFNDFPVYEPIFPRDLIDDLLAVVGFIADYSPAALDILRSTEGDDWQNSRYNIFDLDWYNGIKIGTAVAQVADLLGLQFTIVNGWNLSRRLRFTVIGEPDYPLLEWEGIFATETTIGNAVQTDIDTGIWIVGSRNLYEHPEVPLIPWWNQNWNSFAFDLNLRTEALAIFGMDETVNTVREFGLATGGIYLDDGFIGGRTKADKGAIVFNDMLIKEYVDKILFKVYRISIMDQFLTPEQMDGVRPVLEAPIVGPLFSNPGKQCIVKGHICNDESKDQVVRFISDDIVEMEGGYTLDENNGFVIFDSMRFFVTDEALASDDPGADLTDYIPDPCTITCMFAKEVFREFFGDTERIGVKVVSGLRRTFLVSAIDGEIIELTRPEEKNAGLIAEDIALGLLTRKRIVRSGEETFIGISGHEPTGEIRRITVSVDPDSGISERVSYANDEPSPDVEPYIEVARRLGIDAQIRESIIKKREDDIQRAKDQRKALQKRKREDEDRVAKENLRHLNRDNYIKVENPEATEVISGTPVVAEINLATKNFAKVPAANVTNNDKRTVGIALTSSGGEPLSVVTMGIAKALVTGPCIIGDTLGIDAVTNTLKKGSGSIVAMANQASATPTLIAVKIGGGGGGGGGNSTTARTASTVNIASLSGLGTFDGITLVDGDVLLVKDQTNKAQNDLYTVHAAAWVRTGELASGLQVSVREGANAAGTLWICTTNDPIVVGTTLIDFTVQKQDSFYADVASTVNLPLTGTANVDGQTITGKRVLAKNQTTASQNGLYQVPSSGGGAWQKIGQPKVVEILTGTANGRTRWLLTATDTYSGGYDFYA